MNPEQVLAKTYEIDKVHSSASFEVKHLGVSLFKGDFRDLDATLSVNDDGSLQFEGAVNVNSIDIDDEQLKGHLLSPDFFDVENTPEIRFSSTSVTQQGDVLDVTGELTIKGQTEQVAATGAISHIEADMGGNERYGMDIETTIDRTDYGINWNTDLPKGGKALSNNVRLLVHIELTPKASE